MGRVLLAFEPPDGGVAEHVFHLASRLPEYGWEVEVAGPRLTTIHQRLLASGAPIHPIKELRRGYTHPAADLRAAGQLRRILGQGRFDLVHCHSSKAGLIGRIVARSTSTPAIYTPHGFGFVGDVGAVRRALVPVAERALGRWTDALICVCEAEVRRAHTHRIRAATIRRIYSGVEACPTSDGTLLAPPPLGAGSPVVAMISVFRREKRVDVFLDAAPLVLAADPEASVAVIGEGPLDAELRRRAQRLGLDRHPRFRFIAFTPPSHRYMCQIDLFVLQSDWEAFPISILEALACGVPQVATDVGGVAEAISPRTGVLLPPGDPKRLAAEIIALLRDPGLRATMSEASVARYESHFRVERMLTETDALYREVAGVPERAATSARASVQANRRPTSSEG